MPKSMQMYIILGLRLSYPRPLFGDLRYPCFYVQNTTWLLYNVYTFFLKVKNCHYCQVEASIPRNHERELQPILPPSNPWKREYDYCVQKH